MPALATLSTADAILPLRVRYRQEMNCQIVHDSIHRRDGWTLSYTCALSGAVAGFGSVAIAGPWKDKPTVFESASGWRSSPSSSASISARRGGSAT
jgi:hypothetical protein